MTPNRGVFPGWGYVAWKLLGCEFVICVICFLIPGGVWTHGSSRGEVYVIWIHLPAWFPMEEELGEGNKELSEMTFQVQA